MTPSVAALFEPIDVGPWSLPSRIAMAPMTRNRSPGGVPGADVAAYYGRRAEHGVGLIITEGMTVAHDSANGYRDVPSLSHDVPIDAFRAIADAVHAHGARIIPQLWHVGSIRKPGRPPRPEVPGWGPSAVPHPAYGDNGPVPHAMSDTDVDAILEAFAASARVACDAGFDGVELHGAHGYLVDQFAWPRTNLRTDRWGLVSGFAVRFTEALVSRVKRELGAAQPLVLRFSQWKLGAYDEVLWRSQAELADFLAPLVDAGVDVFHPSTRRFGVPAFDDEPRSLAGVTRAITGKPVIAVGSVGLDVDITTTSIGGVARVVSLDDVAERIAREGIELVAIGRALLAEPRWAELARADRLAEATPYSKSVEDVYR